MDYHRFSGLLLSRHGVLSAGTRRKRHQRVCVSPGLPKQRMEMYVDGGYRRVTLFERVRMASLEERWSKKVDLEGGMIARVVNGRSGNGKTRVVSVDSKAGFYCLYSREECAEQNPDAKHRMKIKLADRAAKFHIAGSLRRHVRRKSMASPFTIRIGLRNFVSHNMISLVGNETSQE